MASRRRERRNSPRNDQVNSTPNTSPRAPRNPSNVDRRRTRRSSPAPRGNVFSVARELDRHEREFGKVGQALPVDPVPDPDVTRGRAPEEPPASPRPSVEKESLVIERVDRCKSKPKKTRGNGGSRDFVPWCKK